MSVLYYLASDFEQAEIYANELLRYDVNLVGLDTETTVGRRDEPEKPSLLQISTKDRCYLFQLYRIYRKTGYLPGSLVRFLKNPERIKVGVAISTDIERLSTYGLVVRGWIDIQYIARSMGISSLSLEDLAKRFISVSHVQSINLRTDWDNELNDHELSYAINDAYYSLMIYTNMFSTPEGNNNLTSIERENLSEKDIQEYKDWIKDIVKMAATSRSLESLINQTVSSYGPWAKRLTPAERRTKAVEILSEMDLTKPADLPTNSSPNSSDISNLYDNFIKYNNGMKLSSLINKICNSYGPWAKLPMGDRKRWAEHSIKILNEQSAISIENNIVKV